MGRRLLQAATSLSDLRLHHRRSRCTLQIKLPLSPSLSLFVGYSSAAERAEQASECAEAKAS